MKRRFQRNERNVTSNIGLRCTRAHFG